MSADIRSPNRCLPAQLPLKRGIPLYQARILDAEWNPVGAGKKSETA
jgi:hypothetical protein